MWRWYNRNMNKNPFFNALLAAVYIVLIVLGISSFESMGGGETIIIPMVMLSLLVLSVAIMGFLFVARPVQLLIENQKHQAIAFFGKTLGTFAVLVIIGVGILLYTS